MGEDLALVMLRRYFSALDAFDVETALDSFTDDVVYVHPPYGQFYEVDDGDAVGPGHELAAGRDQLRQLFAARGEQTTTHHVTGFARTGKVCFNEGVMRDRGGAPVCTWLACFEVDEDDRIRCYVPYASVPPLPLVADGASEQGVSG